MGNAIAHFTHLGEILDILAKILANKNAIKAQISGFERIFSLVICSKVRFGAKCGQNVDLEDLATLRRIIFFGAGFEIRPHRRLLHLGRIGAD